MQTFIATAIASALALLPLAAISANEHDPHAGHGAAMSTKMEGGMVDGVVKKVDKAGGKVTVAHGPLTNLNMPAMTMVFRVKDAAWLDQVKAGDKVRFMADQINGAMTVVHLERN